LVVRLCFHGTLVRGPDRPSFAERLQWARRFGYSAVEVGYREVEAHLAAHPGLTPEQLWSDAGVWPAMVGGVVTAAPFAPEAEWRSALQGLEDRARAAAAIGARVTGTWMPNRSALPPAEARALIRRRFTEVADALAPAGLAFAVELIGVRTLWPELPHAFIGTYADCLQLFEETGRANIGFLLDCYHTHAAETPLEEIARTPRSRILYLHVNDAKPVPPAQVLDADRLIPGEGVIDLVGWFRAVAATGYDGAVAPEVLGPRLQGMTTEQAATACRAGIVAAMERAGVPVE
jgi:sugar phosphate isomerase/epimerase